ncbi:MAG TPA: MOSC N-terminal beta barrel domain-containing protein [Chryseolinea sp.]|nr:MOSC N-terminal beta barrel domain-containing protein [Chryseolinea sp.]
MAELKLTQIWIYPIKSLGGISLSTASVMEKGLRHDRRLMLVDETGTAMTQRVFPKMALFKSFINEDVLTITHYKHSLKLDLKHLPLTNAATVNIWDDTVSAFEVDHSHSQWFSKLLEVPCRLVYFPEENSRPVNPRYHVNGEQVSLADAYPFLIIGQSSLDDVNSRLKEAVPMNRFRPNFVFTGGEPFEEDTWRNFSIGTNRFVGVKLCDRCVLTTVNQDTAERGTEPLKTLSSYRKRDNKVYFGQNLVALDHKTVSVGDTITVQ